MKLRFFLSMLALLLALSGAVLLAQEGEAATPAAEPSTWDLNWT